MYLNNIRKYFKKSVKKYRIAVTAYNKAAANAQLLVRTTDADGHSSIAFSSEAKATLTFSNLDALKME